MASLAIYLLIILGVAAMLILIGIYAYNRHLDKVVRGEERDTHSNIPEPGQTVGAVYKIVLMVLVIISFLTISTMSGKISAMENTLNNLQNRLSTMEYELSSMREQEEDALKRVEYSEWTVTNPNYENRTAEVSFTAALKEFSDDTTVSVSAGGKEIPLTDRSGGTFSARFTADFFDSYDNARLMIHEGDRTYSEYVDFPMYVFWDYLPMPAYDCRFSSGVKLGKLTYEGEYAVVTGHPEEIESATISYLTDGKTLKTMDITKEVQNGETITVEQGLALESDLTFELEIATKTGYKIVHRNVMIYEASPDFTEEDFLRIYDKNGNLLWEDDYK
ncbi:MAG: hypothetical protein IJL78_00515 [Lachnospiraceae bacterium]|nr:hypothetical protein [Lachnospiraceae bacterium]